MSDILGPKLAQFRLQTRVRLKDNQPQPQAKQTLAHSTKRFARLQDKGAT